MVFTAMEAPTVTPTPAEPPSPREKLATPALASMLVLSAALTETDPAGTDTPMSLSRMYAVTLLTTVFTDPAPATLTPTPALPPPPPAALPPMERDQIVVLASALRPIAPPASSATSSR